MPDGGAEPGCSPDPDAEPGGAPAEPPLPNVVDAGFWDRSRGSGPGFVAGGVADRLEPGPVLTHLTEEAWRRGLDKLTDDELIGVLRGGPAAGVQGRGPGTGRHRRPGRPSHLGRRSAARPGG